MLSRNRQKKHEKKKRNAKKERKKNKEHERVYDDGKTRTRTHVCMIGSFNVVHNHTHAQARTFHSVRLCLLALANNFILSFITLSSHIIIAYISFYLDTQTRWLSRATTHTHTHPHNTYCVCVSVGYQCCIVFVVNLEFKSKTAVFFFFFGRPVRVYVHIKIIRRIYPSFALCNDKQRTYLYDFAFFNRRILRRPNLLAQKCCSPFRCVLHMCSHWNPFNWKNKI